MEAKEMGENKGRQQGCGRGLGPFRISCVIYKLLRSGNSLVQCHGEKGLPDP